MKKLLLSLMAFVAMAVNAQEVTIALDSSMGKDNGTSITTVAQDGVTLTFDKGGNSNAPKYYTTGNATRLYGGNTVTIASDKTITKAVFTISGSNSFNANTSASVGDFDMETLTWTGSANEVTIKNGGTSGHARISAITVTLASDEPYVTSDVKDIYFWNYAYDDPEYGSLYLVNSQQVTFTEVNFEENIVLSAVMKSSGKGSGATLANSTKFSTSGTVFSTKKIKVSCTSKKPGVYEDVLQLKDSEGKVWIEVPVKMVIAGTDFDGQAPEYSEDEDGYFESNGAFSVADAYAIHDIMPTGGSYCTDPTHEWSAFSVSDRYFKGVVESVSSISTSYGNATFKIKDADSATTLDVFRVLGLDNAAITDENLVGVGDEVIIKADLVDYNGKPELKDGYIYSIKKNDIALGIKAVEAAQSGVIYNLAGQRVDANAKGIVIMNGKKVVK